MGRGDYYDRYYNDYHPTYYTHHLRDYSPYQDPYYSHIAYGLYTPYFDNQYWELDDDEIAENIRDEIDSSDIPRRDRENIDIEVTDGVVTLSGLVRNRWVKWRAFNLAYWSPGVYDVANEIEIRNNKTERSI